MSVFNRRAGSSLPQALGPTDSPTFDDLKLNGQLEMDGPIYGGDIFGTYIAATVEVRTAALIFETPSLGDQMVFNRGGDPESFISVPVPYTGQVHTVPDGGGDNSFILSRVASGGQTIAGTLAVAGALTAGQFRTAATSAQLVTASASAYPTTISVPTMAQTSTITLADPGVAASRFVLSGAPLTSGVVVSSAAGTVSSSVTPSLTSVAFSSNLTTPLSVYTQGTFTPTLTFGGGSTGLTLSVATGDYTRIGNRVMYNVAVTVSAVGSSTGISLIGGLPYAALGTSSFGGAIVATGITFTATYTDVDAVIAASATAFTLNEVSAVSGGSGSTSLQLTHANFNVGTLIRITGSYPTAAAA